MRKFPDLSQSLVGDVTELTPVQKLQYLKVSLSDEVAAIVANVELSDEGYDGRVEISFALQQ